MKKDKPPSASAVAEEILHSVLASPRRERHLLSRTLWGKFGFRVRTEKRIQQVSEALRQCNLNAKVESGQLGKESERERIILTYTGSIAPTINQIPTPPEAWFLKIEQRNFENERKVEFYFVMPLLEQLGYQEADVAMGFPIEVKPG